MDIVLLYAFRENGAAHPELFCVIDVEPEFKIEQGSAEVTSQTVKECCVTR